MKGGLNPVPLFLKIKRLRFIVTAVGLARAKRARKFTKYMPIVKHPIMCI